MSRINSNIPAMIARSNLGKANSDLETRLQRLSTGLRINRGADDPAGLIISQRLGSEISGLNQAIRNTERASSVISTAEGGLNEVSELLNSIKGLVVEAANTGALSAEERKANQLQIDSAIDSITRISESASFGGLKLLNGSLDYVTSGLRTSAISRARVFNASLVGRSSVQVNVDVLQSAQTGRLFLRGDYAAFSAGLQGRLTSAVRLEVAGPRGVRVLEFIQGTPLSSVRDGINSLKPATGVSASLGGANGTSGLVVSSTGFGRDEFVSLTNLRATGVATTFQPFRLQDDLPVTTSTIAQRIASGNLIASGRDSGRDVFALVNGALAAGNGLTVTLPDSTSLGLELTLTTDLATRPAAAISTFYVTGGGALYQLGGTINQSQQINLGLPTVAASRLGGVLIEGTMQFLESIKSGGANDLNSNRFTFASDILSAAIDEISVIRGRLGAMEKNTLDTNVRSIQTAVESLTSSQSVIRDADFADETSRLTRSQILAQTGTSVLQLANQQAQSVLSLLQR
jgi:flagellin